MRFAIDIGGTHIRVGAASAGFDWQHMHRSRWSDRIRPEEVLDLVAGLIDEWKTGRPRSIGVSIAAVVDGDGLLSGSENLGWAGVNLRHEIEQRFGCPAVIETDVNCGALYELRAGEAQGANSALYVAIGTGVGHAFILNGQLWVGARRGANALGHLVINPDGKPCYCGHLGCLCTVASGRAQSDGKAGAEALEALAQALGAAVTLIEPQRIILAGGALNQPWFDLQALIDLLPAYSFPAALQPHLIRTQAPDPNLCGALLLTQEKT
ncbi:ROK family protein [Hoeflea olei]|uniref:Sugar kinase n=1 Tax=Hoeflea olei TaxID=1480615 RepID=A0A1C1YU36_9HYPH|nr:ROK family protein [Hoeflea olei]OCW57053.1 hypothetical protein AWJ14_07840 [Hoeflea olei]